MTDITTDANMPSERLDSDCPTDANLLEVMVKPLMKKKVTTIVQLVTPMIEAAASYYERLHNMKVEETVKIVFKLSFDYGDKDKQKDKDGKDNHNTDKEDGNKKENKDIHSVCVVCTHMHPFLDKQVWLETKGRMGSTFLTVNKVSVTGFLAHERYKKESKASRVCTLEEILGAFLITKEMRDTKQSGEYAMMALAKHDNILCISCGYPMWRGFAPEKHLRFDRMQTCSYQCFHIRSHYKETDEENLKKRTVKGVTNAIHASSAYFINSLRHANCELMDCDSNTSPHDAHLINKVHLRQSTVVAMKYATNASLQVGQTCNKTLKNASNWKSITSENTPVMGSVQPPKMSAKVIKKWSSAMMASPTAVNHDVTDEIRWRDTLKNILGEDTKPNSFPKINTMNDNDDMVNRMEERARGKEEDWEAKSMKLQQEIHQMKQDNASLCQEIQMLTKKVATIEQENVMLVEEKKMEVKQDEIPNKGSKDYYLIGDSLYVLRHVRGDGDCFYSSLLLSPEVSSCGTVDNLRQKVVDYVMNDCDELKEGTKNFYKGRMTLEQWADYTTKHGTWGSMWEAVIVSLIFSIEIMFLYENEKGIGHTLASETCRIYYKAGYSQSNYAGKKTIYLLLHRMGKENEPRRETEFDHFGYFEPMSNIQSDIKVTFMGVKKETDSVTKNKDNTPIEIVDSPVPKKKDETPIDIVDDDTAERVQFTEDSQNATRSNSHTNAMGDEGVETNKDDEKDASSNSHTHHTTTKDYDQLMDEFLEDRRQKFLEELTLCEDNEDELWRRKRQLVIAYVQEYQTYDLEAMQLCCEKCKTMYNQDYYVMTPKVGNRQWEVLCETPKTVRQHPDLRKMFGHHIDDHEECGVLCQWDIQYVEACLILLCHAFHCSQVHCVMVADYMIDSKAVMGGKQADKDDTLLAIVHHNEGHFGVVQVDPSNREVHIWDAAEANGNAMALYWRKHVEYILEQLKGDEVIRKDGHLLNVISMKGFMKLSDQEKREGVEGHPWWKVKGVVKRTGHKQKDEYTCGPIAINRFASLLLELSTKKGGAGRKVMDTDLLAKIHSPDKSKENNKRDAIALFSHLLTTRWEEESPANNDRGCSTPKNSGPEITEEQPRTPRNGTGQQMSPDNGSGCTGDDVLLRDLVDTPEQPKVDNVSAKLLRKGRTGKGIGKKEVITLDGTKGDIEHADISKKRGKVGEQEQQWSHSEGERIFHGHKIKLLHQFGFTKAVADRYEKICAEYKILKDMEKIYGYENSVEKEADYLCSVRGVNPKGVLTNKEWLRSEVLCHPEVIEKNCYYHDMQDEGIELNPKMQERAKRMYAAKMKEEEKPLRVVKCDIHGEGNHSLRLKMGK